MGSNSSRSQSHHNQQLMDRNRQSMQPSMDKLSMEAYKKRQGQVQPGSSSTNQTPTLHNSQQSRTMATSLSDPTHQNRKRQEQQHHSTGKKAHISSSAQKTQLMQGKVLPNQAVNPS